MVRIFLILSILLLSGCSFFSKPDPEIVYRDVYVSVPVHPDIPEIEKPELKIKEITPTTPDDEAVKLYQATIEQLKDFSNSLLIIIDSIRKAPTSK